MKKLAMVVLLFSALAWAAPNPADYPLNVHISGSHFGERPSTVYLNATIDGKKYILLRVSSFQPLVMPGDYKARVIKSEHKKDYSFSGSFQLLFANGDTETYTVDGISE